MITVKREGVLLQSTGLYFENGGVQNPAVYQDGQTVYLFYRGLMNGGVSMIGYCRLDGPLTVTYRADEPVLVPEYAYEAFGVEDPRIVKIEGVWYLTYTAYDGAYALGALATSCDLPAFQKKGIIVPKLAYRQFLSMTSKEFVNEKYFNYRDSALWDKNTMFFPRRIHGKLYFLHRIRPGIQIAAIDDLTQLNGEYWGDYLENFHHFVLLDPQHRHESIYIGGGCPPIETKEGWLVIYHGTGYEQGEFVYSACAALLDLDDPCKVIARLPYAFFSPKEPWEKSGVTNNVVFPTGTAQFGNMLYIYYGSADACIAVASVILDELLAELLKHPTRIKII